MGIDAKHPQYTDNVETWDKIDAVVKGENVSQFLRYLNPQDKSADNLSRNQQYKENAIFYAIAGQTVAGMLGTMYRKWPTLTVPTPLDYLSKNCDGAGNSIYQQSQGLADDLISKSRGALLVSYPPTDGAVSQADIVSGSFSGSLDPYSFVERF
jgi:hypothetical protein